MPISKERIKEHFCVGDVISCPDGSALYITAILDDEIRLKSSGININEISINFMMLSDAFDAFSTNPSENPMSLFHGILAEYNKRAGQARRDEEVDAMWAGAMVCELP